MKHETRGAGKDPDFARLPWPCQTTIFVFQFSGRQWRQRLPAERDEGTRLQVEKEENRKNALTGLGKSGLGVQGTPSHLCKATRLH